MRLLLLISALAVLLAPNPRLSRADSPRKLLMGVLGDSITAASLADFPIPEGSSDEERIQKWAKQATDSRFLFENKYYLSWASGRKINSQFRHLESWLKDHGEKRELEVYNVAYPGDTSYDLVGQANKMVEEARSGLYDSVKYIVILIGANDACSKKSPIGSPLDEMHANLLKTIEILSTIRQEEPLRILLVGIPRIPDLATPAFRNAKTVFGLSCERVRQGILHFCDPLLGWKTADEYGDKMQVVEDKNRLLRMIVQEVNTRFPNVEMVYSNRLYNLEIPINVLAIDCFHPNADAQNQISNQTWMDQPWFN